MLAYELEGVESPFWHTKSLLSIYSFGFLYTIIYYYILLYYYCICILQDLRSLFSEDMDPVEHGTVAIFVLRIARGEVTGTFDRIYSVGMFVTWFLRGVGLKPCWMCRICRISNCFVGKQILLGHCFLLESPGKPFLFWLANLIHAHAGPNGVQRTIWEQFLPHLQAEGWCVCFL